LRGLNLQVFEGEFLMLMGASGSGKTTLMNIIGCLDRPTSGSFWFNGQAVEHLDDNQLSHLRKREIGFIFQSFNLLPRLKAWANVALPLVYQEVPAAKRRAVAEEMLQHVGLAQKGERLPGELSGGEQQRVAIARALASQPHLLLADEPTGNLDSKTGEEIMEILKKLHHSGITIVMVTHAREMIKYSDRSIIMKDGLILED
jgi:putative ABC transport system ATP-binding protein